MISTDHYYIGIKSPERREHSGIPELVESKAVTTRQIASGNYDMLEPGLRDHRSPEPVLSAVAHEEHGQPVP